MAQSPIDPEKDPPEPDEFDRLEDTFNRFKVKMEAWRKLLENLDDLKKPIDNPGTENPSS